MFGHDISNLMMGTFSGNERDEFGKEKDARLPLLLPKVMEGRPIVSTSPLFGLPAEIIGDIIDLIANDPASLAALALVNSDCRQLARSCQFADVCFDYSINSGLLLMRLLGEARVRSGGDVSQPAFIGPCVRRVTVRPRDSCVARLNRDLYESIWGDGARDISHEQRAELREKATAQYFTIFRNPILAALAHSMPNLEALSWCDPMCLDDTFLRMVTRLPIRHLMLLRVNIAEPYRLEPPLAPPALPLESLTLSPRICGDERHRDSAGDDAAWEARSISPFAATLLQLCSGTLLRLVFSSLAFFMEKSISFGPEPIVFSRLRHLNLSGLHTRLDAVAWSSLLSAPLTHLSLCWGNSDPTFIQALSTCQPFRDLDTLVVQTLAAKEPANAQAVIDFISRHPHTRKLSVGCSEPHLVDTYLLPALSDGRWSNLTSLSLAWDGPGMDEATAPNIATIAAESLAAIGSITSLEQLCLSAGVSAGWRHQWLIDHDVLRASFRGLARLKRLAFSRDTYSPRGLPATLVEAYYEYRILSPIDRAFRAMRRRGLSLPGDESTGEGTDDDDDDGGDDSGLGDEEIWERHHRRRMVREAEKYAAVLPELEWIYCGQWPMDIRKEETSSGTRRVAVPSSEERDTCWTLLRRMFSMGEDDN